MREIFTTFLMLGLTSFGGPIAHLGYFRDEFVLRRKWLSDKDYADLVALCQFLPGPASSQVGFAIGLQRGGFIGALAAFIGFTLPSALLIIAFAYGASIFNGDIGSAIINGLKIVAVAIVAQAVLGMVKTLSPDRERATIAVVAVLIVIVLAGAYGQVAAILAGALAGLVVCRGSDISAPDLMSFNVSRRTGLAALLAFAVLLIGLPIVATTSQSQSLAIFDAFYRAGSLVFGGGHVVLPLLENEVVRTGWVSSGDFLAGYGAAQAMPGPLFTFATYLGAVLGPTPNGLTGALIATTAIFLPGFLLLIGALPFWSLFRSAPRAQAAMAGANAAVVGILGAALYDPVFTSAITSPPSFALALSCFALLTVWKTPPWLVVLVAAVGGVVIG